MVHEIFRHGARESIYDYYDGYKYEIDAGEITPFGMRMHYELGKKLR
jgi:hypothetical protein